MRNELFRSLSFSYFGESSWIGSAFHFKGHENDPGVFTVVGLSWRSLMNIKE